MDYNNSTNNNQFNKKGVFEVERFKDRIEELRLLRERISSTKFEFGITYGRRRVGKTALHLQASSKNRVIYFLARRSRNIEKFKEQCVKIVPAARMIALDYESLFEFLKDKVDCIIIDEFPNMLQEDANILHIFQAIVDSILPGSSLALFFLGSSISVMKSKVLPASSPLYGRKTMALKLSAIPFYILSEYYPHADMEEIIQIYGLADGIPYYLNQINDSFWKWLDKELKFPTYLRDEGEFLVRYEFINSGRYLAILEAI
ncbi:MAG: ATP-binding protein, partial [Candidatus Heimdallarchaeota archaeon]|nr:ATP-binding protein [Candidatus Heimdallarchaeota archaeon]